MFGRKKDTMSLEEKIKIIDDYIDRRRGCQIIFNNNMKPVNFLSGTLERRHHTLRGKAEKGHTFSISLHEIDQLLPYYK